MTPHFTPTESLTQRERDMWDSAYTTAFAQLRVAAPQVPRDTHSRYAAAIAWDAVELWEGAESWGAPPRDPPSPPDPEQRGGA